MPTRFRKQAIKLPALFVSNAGRVNSSTSGAWKPKLGSHAGPCARTDLQEALLATEQSCRSRDLAVDDEREIWLPAIASTHSARNLLVESAAWNLMQASPDSGRTTRIGAACGGPDVAFMVRNNRHVRLDHLQSLGAFASAQFARKRKLMAMSDADGRGSPEWSKKAPCEGRAADSDYDIDSETLCYSLTLPTIEAVLTEEGISSKSISQQMAQIRERCRSRYPREPPIFPSSQLNELRRTPRIVDTVSDPLSTSSPRPSLLTALLTDRLRETTPRMRALPVATNEKLSASSRVAPHDTQINELSTDIKGNIDAFLDEIEHTKWLSRQQIEMTNMGSDFVPPRIVVVPSNIPHCSSLLENVVRKSGSVLTIDYDFQTATYETVLGLIRQRLDSYRRNCRARSLLFYCKGGPGYIYMVNKRVVTPQKLNKQHDLQTFWRDVGEFMTKIDHSQTKVHIAGCDLLGNKQGYDLLTDISKLMYPNSVGVECADEVTSPHPAEHILKLYLDFDKYLAWTTAVQLLKREQEKCTDHDALPLLQLQPS